MILCSFAEQSRFNGHWCLGRMGQEEEQRKRGGILLSFQGRLKKVMQQPADCMAFNYGHCSTLRIAAWEVDCRRSIDAFRAQCCSGMKPEKPACMPRKPYENFSAPKLELFWLRRFKRSTLPDYLVPLSLVNCCPADLVFFCAWPYTSKGFKRKFDTGDNRQNISGDKCQLPALMWIWDPLFGL